jgi:hypothetical protein
VHPTRASGDLLWKKHAIGLATSPGTRRKGAGHDSLFQGYTCDDAAYSMYRSENRVESSQFASSDIQVALESQAMQDTAAVILLRAQTTPWSRTAVVRCMCKVQTWNVETSQPCLQYNYIKQGDVCETIFACFIFIFT